VAKDSRDEVGWIELVLGTGSLDCTGSFDNRGRPDGRPDCGGWSSILTLRAFSVHEDPCRLSDDRNASAQIAVFGWCRTTYTTVGWPARIEARFDVVSNARGGKCGAISRISIRGRRDRNQQLGHMNEGWNQVHSELAVLKSYGVYFVHSPEIRVEFQSPVATPTRITLPQGHCQAS
jgi:hypothetical protein